MRRVAVMAHFDPRGEVGPHVQRQVQKLARATDHLVVVSTAPLTDSARSFLSTHAQLVQRPNEGYDFMSYRRGIEVLDLTGADELVVCNDTYVPVGEYTDLFASMESKPVDFWGYTKSKTIRPHLQSFFAVFRPWVIRSKAFDQFWHSVTPVANRHQVILKFEIGMTQALQGAGFRSAPVFNPTAYEERLARARMFWLALHRNSSLHLRHQQKRFVQMGRSTSNPAAVWADRVLDDARMPFVKIDTLRHDPYGLGSKRLLSLCEKKYPEEFAGVRDFLEETTPWYPTRPGETLRATPRSARPLRRLVGYGHA